MSDIEPTAEDQTRNHESAVKHVTGAALSFLLGGVFVPLTVFPEWMQKCAVVIPVVPALHGFRQAVLHDANWATMWPDIAHVLVFMAVLVPLSIVALRWAVRRAMLDGSLTQY